MNLEIISSENMNKEIAYLFGVYLTDASITRRVSPTQGCTFQLQVIDQDFAEFTLECLKKMIPECKGNVTMHGYEPKATAYNKKICYKYCVGVGFSRFGDFFESQTGKKHHIPFVIWDAPLDIQKWFIAGVMDGDGWISIQTNGLGNRKAQIRYSIGVGKTEESWIWEFQKLLQQIGIRVFKPDISMHHTKNGQIIRYNNPVVRLHMDVNDFVGKGLFFTIKRKQDRIKRIIHERSETKRCTPLGVKI